MEVMKIALRLAACVVVALPAVAVLACTAHDAAESASAESPAAATRVLDRPVTVDAGVAPEAAHLVLHLDGVRTAGSQSAVLRVLVDGKVIDELYLVGAQSSGQNHVVVLPDGAVKKGARVQATLVPAAATDVTIARAWVGRAE